MMKQKMKKKLTSFASIGLSAAILFISTPITHVAAAEELQSQSVVNQGLQGYLANSQQPNNYNYHLHQTNITDVLY